MKKKKRALKHRVGVFLQGAGAITCLISFAGIFSSLVGLVFKCRGGDYSGWMIMGMAEEPFGELVLLLIVSIFIFAISACVIGYAEEKLMDKW